MLLGFAGNTKLIDEAILAEAARDLDMPSVFADMYRMDPSAAESAAHSRDGHGVDTFQSGRERNFVRDQRVKVEGSDVSQQSRLRQAETAAMLTPSGNGSTNGYAENMPRELIEAIVRISQTLEQQKALLAAIPAPSAEAQPASESDNAAALGTIVTAPAKTFVKAKAITKAATSAPAAKTDSTTSGIPSGNGRTRTRETSLVQNASKNGSTPGSEMVPPTPVAVPDSITRSYHPKPRKPAESGRFWSKALALVAITGVLTFVVIEKSPWQNMARANGTEQSQFAPDTSDASSGFVVPKGSPASPMDAPVRGASDVRAHSSQDRFDDVTVRKFPEDRSATAIDGTDMQDGRTVFFEQDSDDITGQYRSTLQEIAAGLEKDPEASAILEGHTDDSGPEAYNLDLSSRRAIAVRNALVNEFNVSSTRLTAIGSGSSSPVQPNSSAAGRASNRRVSVRLVHLGE
jgi:outer membrane protein OmpA-like peptidoglycan-associated protein